jgi:hypothetical protein
VECLAHADGGDRTLGVVDVIALPRAFEAIDPTARVSVTTVVLVWLAAVVGLYGALEWPRRFRQEL